jgi:acyl-CoA synthetase (AMP-forming)/AMP-acid ligase II
MRPRRSRRSSSALSFGCTSQARSGRSGEGGAQAGGEADAEGIIAFARTRLAEFKAPKSVDFVSTPPRGPSGNVLRMMLRERIGLGGSGV